MRYPVFYSHTTADVLSDLQERILASGLTDRVELIQVIEELKKELADHESPERVSALMLKVLSRALGIGKGEKK